MREDWDTHHWTEQIGHDT